MTTAAVEAIGRRSVVCPSGCGLQFVAEVMTAKAHLGGGMDCYTKLNCGHNARVITSERNLRLMRAE